MWHHKLALLILFRTRTWRSTYTDVTSCLEHKNRNTHVNVTECYRDRNRSKLICTDMWHHHHLKTRGWSQHFPHINIYDIMIRGSDAEHRVLKDAKKPSCLFCCIFVMNHLVKLLWLQQSLEPVFCRHLQKGWLIRQETVQHRTWCHSCP